ncbi:hypothetical protein [Phascolarctobacterium faecium]|uniref:hypothetical protein n=1 Tax=Phascolarctobacterium faecium TaxID=33025 RepID=UPI003079B665
MENNDVIEIIENFNKKETAQLLRKVDCLVSEIEVKVKSIVSFIFMCLFINIFTCITVLWYCCNN